MEAMDQLNSLCLHHDFLDEERFIRLLAETASRDDLNTGISGFAAAILLERGRMEEEELSRQVRLNTEQVLKHHLYKNEFYRQMVIFPTMDG